MSSVQKEDGDAESGVSGSQVGGSGAWPRGGGVERAGLGPKNGEGSCQGCRELRVGMLGSFRDWG